MMSDCLGGAQVVHHWCSVLQSAPPKENKRNNYPLLKFFLKLTPNLQSNTRTVQKRQTQSQPTYLLNHNQIIGGFKCDGNYFNKL